MRTFAVGFFILLAGACTAAEAQSVQDLDDVGPLREVFNEDEGSPRLLLLLSPT